MTDWKLYDDLIEGIPNEVLVRDACMGAHWSYVEAECGVGVANTCRGGTRERLEKVVARPLREIAQLSKSWDFEAASLGIAAMNAWYNRREFLIARDFHAVFDVYLSDDCDVKPDSVSDPFCYFPARLEDFAQREGRKASVVSVGKFSFDEAIAQKSAYTVLERQRRDGDNLPDTACEFVIPSADFVLVTGMTEANKTLSRLSELSRNAQTFLVGPSSTIAGPLFAAGVDETAGSIVSDPERVKAFVEIGNSPLRSGGMQTCVATKRP